MLANPPPHPHPNPDPHPTPNQAELEELQGTITSVEDLLRNEMTRSIVEVVEAEVGERVVETLDTVVQLNETESSVELKALLRAAGKGQDGTVTLDDLYTLVAGEGAEP